MKWKHKVKTSPIRDNPDDRSWKQRGKGKGKENEEREKRRGEKRRGEKKKRR